MKVGGCGRFKEWCRAIFAGVWVGVFVVGLATEVLGVEGDGATGEGVDVGEGVNKKEDVGAADVDSVDTPTPWVKEGLSKKPTDADINPPKGRRISPSPSPTAATSAPFALDDEFDFGFDALNQFPWLPGESEEASRSVGNVTTGWVYGGKDLREIEGVSFFENQNQRQLHYTGDNLYDLILGTVARLKEEEKGLGPLPPLFLGNFSARHGGDIAYSVSHNSGRDGDLAFFATDFENRPVDSPGIVPYDDVGRNFNHGTIHRFDVARNWRLVESLMTTNQQQIQQDRRHHAAIQYIFISDGLKKLLIDYAKQNQVDRKIIESADRLLRQPGGALPHDDHFHIRVYCSDVDVESGCKDSGVGGYRSLSEYSILRSRVINDAARTFRDSKVLQERRQALRRLLLLQPNHRLLVEGLGDADPVIRATAARSPLFWGDPEGAFRQLREEKNRFVYGEMLASLLQSEDAEVSKLLLQELGEAKLIPIGILNTSTDIFTNSTPTPLPCPTSTSHLERLSDFDGRLDMRGVMVEYLGRRESKEVAKRLILELGRLTQGEKGLCGWDRDLAIKIDQSLELLTNQETPRGLSLFEKGYWWRMWWKEHEGKSREKWLLEGFALKGYNLETLDDARGIWTLILAIKGTPPYISWNAHRAVARLSRSDAPTFEWSNHDAQYHWRRWFQKKSRRREVPPVPPELDVDLHPYQKEE